MDRENIFINEYNIGSIGSTSTNGASEQMHKYLFTPIWDNSDDQSGPFESSLSSMVSSPTTSNAPPPPGGCTNDNIVLKELIGRLGSIYNSGEVMNLNNSAKTSCFSTPMNSPPKLNLSIMDHQISQIRGNSTTSTTSTFPGSHFPAQSSLTQLTNDPGFAERAAKYSCFADKNMDNSSGKLSRVSSNQSLMKVSGSQMNNGQENKDGDQNSSVSEQNPGGEFGLNGQNDMNSRKRKSSFKGKGKDAHSAKEANDGVENNELSAKRSKSDESENEKDNSAASENKKEGKGNQKPSEGPKDYIHVRARRGQATDAHSLAERVRREKISQKMKLLQDLVPGCNKVTGKAVMLDEIINYVQSLQLQVEFLSMKLATIDPRMDVNLEGLLPKEMFQSCESVPNSNYALNNSAAAYTFPLQSQQVPNMHINPVLGPNLHLPPVEINKGNGNSSQGGTFFEDDLQSMIFGQNQAHIFQGVMPTDQMKVEL